MTDPVLSVSKGLAGRFYQHPESKKEVPSVTNITGMKAKPALAPWGYRKCAEFAMAKLDVLKGLSAAEGVDLIRQSPYRNSDEAAKNGDIVHGWIERWIKHGEFDPAEEDPVDYNQTTKWMWANFIALH